MRWNYLHLLFLSGLLVLTACWDQGGLQSGTLPYPITAVAVNPVNPSIVYLATRGNGVYKSTNYGGTWQKSNVGLLDLAVEDLAVDLFDPNTIYAGTESGVYKSIDEGDNWLLPAAGSGTGITAIVIDRNSCITKGLPCKNLYTASESEGIHKSTDSGFTWSPMNAGLSETAVKSLAVYPPLFLPGQCNDFPEECQDQDIRNIPPLPGTTTLYAGTEGGHVFRILDLPGSNWMEGNPGLSEKTTQEVISLAVHPITPNILYAGMGIEGGQGGTVYRSSDQGGNWNEVIIPTTVRDSVYALDFARVPDPNDLNEIVLATYISVNGLSRDINDSNNWVAINSNLYRNVLSLAIDPLTPTTMYAGTYRNGLFKTVDGGVTWNSIEIPL